MPLVFQYDSPVGPDNAIINRLRSLLNDRGAPEFATVATQGIGVFESLRTLARMMLLRLNV
jgi:hypothetical protein